MKRIPNVGDIIPAFDDGKIRFSRLYEAKITKVVPFEEAKTMKLDDLPVEGPYEEYDSRWLIDIWGWNKNQCPWVFSDETDYFIEAEMPGEVANPNYFATTPEPRKGSTQVSISGCLSRTLLVISLILGTSLVFFPCIFIGVTIIYQI